MNGFTSPQLAAGKFIPKEALIFFSLAQYGFRGLEIKPKFLSFQKKLSYCIRPWNA